MSDSTHFDRERAYISISDPCSQNTIQKAGTLNVSELADSEAPRVFQFVFKTSQSLVLESHLMGRGSCTTSTVQGIRYVIKLLYTAQNVLRVYSIQLDTSESTQLDTNGPPDADRTLVEIIPDTK